MEYTSLMLNKTRGRKYLKTRQTICLKEYIDLFQSQFSIVEPASRRIGLLTVPVVKILAVVSHRAVGRSSPANTSTLAPERSRSGLVYGRG